MPELSMVNHKPTYPMIMVWLKEEGRLDDSVDTFDSTDQKKRSDQNCQILDKAVLTWFVKERQANIPNSSIILSNQAHKLQSDLHISNPSDLFASKDWLRYLQHCSWEHKTMEND